MMTHQNDIFLRHRLHMLVWLVVGVLMASGAINTACADPVSALALKYFPQADRVGAFAGEPLAGPVYEGDRLLGYVLRTTDVAPIPAYSGKPITLLVGIYLDGTIAGVRITDHSEPILDAGVSELDLKYFVYQYLDITVEDRVKLGGADREGYETIDSITGASITAMVMNATIMKAIKKVAESRGIPLQHDGARLWPEPILPVEVPASRQAP
ncbi:MAG: FMN-binding protein, partial [Gammaproteobacteria bacterium]|nr:FMN-binding protein [Gammaproteobacteria bacterium]